MIVWKIWGRFMKKRNFIISLVLFLSILILQISCIGFGKNVPQSAEFDLNKGKTAVKPVIIDTDMAPDDWMAILYLLQRNDIHVKAITISGSGETHTAPGVENITGLIALAGKQNIAVAGGRDLPLRGTHVFPDPWRKNADAMMGLELPESQSNSGKMMAVELLLEKIKKSQEKITILALGPLTNIAEAFIEDPSIKENMEKIYIMGGAVNVSGNAKIHNPDAEWNIYIDPYAANVILESGIPIVLVPLDATNCIPITMDFFNQIKNGRNNSSSQFIYNILLKQEQFIHSGNYYFWDPLAAAILTDESIASFQAMNLKVIETEGPESGKMEKDPSGPLIQVAVSADKESFENTFLNTINKN